VDSDPSHPALDGQIQPRILLLVSSLVNKDAVGGDRVKRSPVGGNTTASDSTSLTRGYAQNEDFLKDVDITEENIDNKIQNHNLSISISNVSMEKLVQ